MKVVKFGGSSLASSTQLNKVLNIVKSDAQRKIIVVSAPGKRSADDEKVTDLLIDYADAFLANLDYQEIQDRIIQRYEAIAYELELGETIIGDIRQGILGLAEETESSQDAARVMDRFKASGEDNNAKLVATYFKKNGLNARYMNPQEAGMIVSDEPGNALILANSYSQILKLRDTDEILVIPGFFGYTKDGDICTFSRGGSDITGSIIAAGTHADLYENFTDVDAIYAAHPGLVKHPHKIKELTFREMRELSYAGFGVFHDEALIPAFRAGIEVVIKNTNNPSAPGTRILLDRQLGDEGVIGIAGDSGFAIFYMSKYLMNREIGFGRKVLEILEDESLNYEHMPSGIDDISIILREHQLTSEVEDRLINRFKEELHVDEIYVNHNLSMIAIVGEGMKSNVGTAAKSTNALSAAGVNLEMINQGSSEVSILFGIKSCHEDIAIKALYKTFFN
ncbi:aspartate kinase [Vagococcus sp. BWB3-3]|uniref:Aspartokinase n=1 Tax=Vagococcus allomyrinae TaxID=2794353 RepID=A0A940PDJ6_9ENTE|nr:aspartate kinase [Vagococcus allomyrinae]MBP1044086.1 aspartate kinase [Vagococcus allomyrinae]